MADLLHESRQKILKCVKEKTVSPPYFLGFRMRQRLTEDQRPLDAKNELDGGILQARVLSVYRGQD